MKIKLMIVALAVVSGLHGFDRGQVVSTKDSAALEKALDSCIESRSYAFTDRKRPIVVCCLKETNNKEAIHYLTQNVIDKECKSIDGNFARMTKVYWYPGTVRVTKIKNVESDQWVDQNDTTRLMLCTVYNLGGGTEKEDISNVNQLLGRDPRAPFLVVATSSDLKSLCKVVEQDIASCNAEFASALLQSAKELVVDEVDKILNNGDLLDQLLKKSENLTFDSKAFQSNSEKKQVAYLSNFSKFFTNHWGKLAGVSLTAFLAYYYNFAR